MKLRAVQTHLNTNVPKVGEFKIKASGKAFKILSSGLYSDKISAIIRELSCNAYDAHVAAGCPEKPFVVHVPNKMEPWFGVQDFGIGLSDHEINNLYTTFFDSTKTESDDYIGALGLGSKSPFSYTDSFTVIAVKDGVKGTYTAFMNEEGCPSIFCLDQEETKDPNGVLVQVPVSVNDIWDFERRIGTIFSVFKTKPKLVGVHDGFEKNLYKEEKYILEEPDSYYIKDEYDSKHYAIMGNVKYPIDKSQFDCPRALADLGLTIIFKIGQLDVNAGRESLSYDKDTIAALNKRYQEIAGVIQDNLLADIHKNKTFFDCAIHVQNIRSTKLREFLPEKITFKNKEYDLQEFSELDIRSDLLAGYHFIGIEQGYRKAPEVTNYISKNIYASTYAHRPRVFNIDAIPIRNRLYYLDDLGGNKGILRVKQLLKKIYKQTNKAVTAYVVSLDKDCYKGCNKNELLTTLNFITSKIEGLEVYYTSDLDPLEKEKGVKKDKAPWLYKLDVSTMYEGESGNTYARKRKVVDHTALNLHLGTYTYIVSNGLSIDEEITNFHQSKHYGLSSLIRVCNLLHKKEVYVVTKAEYNNIKKLKNWVLLDQEVVNLFHANTDDIANYETFHHVSDVFDTSSTIGAYSLVSNMLNSNIKPMIDIVKKYEIKGDMGVISKLIDYHGRNSGLLEKLGFKKKEINQGVVQNDCDTIKIMFSNLSLKYELLKYLNFYQEPLHIRERLLKEYIGA